MNCRSHAAGVASGTLPDCPAEWGHAFLHFATADEQGFWGTQGYTEEKETHGGKLRETPFTQCASVFNKLEATE